MNHKHIAVIIEDHDYSGLYTTQEIINDLIDYVESLERNPVSGSEDHDKRCISNRVKGEVE